MNAVSFEFDKLALPLVEWYRSCARDLPWRRTAEPYPVWVSEIMLQQTRVEAVKPYYARFLGRYPDVWALAEAGEELIKLWEGLGYYSRARNLAEAARQVRALGGFPETFEGLKKLKGVGEYTAAAVASISFGVPAAAVDGNVLRVFSRLCCLEDDISLPAVRREVFSVLSAAMPQDRAALETARATPFFLPRNDAGDFNQAMMELGACVCLPNGAPRCGECPLAALCEAHRAKSETAFPVRTERRPRRIEERTVLLLEAKGRTALVRRPQKGLLAGLWEFPSLPGRLEEAEVRAALEDLGLRVLRLVPLGDAKHVFTHLEWRMTGWRAELEAVSAEDGTVLREAKESGRKVGLAWRADAWGTREELAERFALPSALEFYRKKV